MGLLHVKKKEKQTLADAGQKKSEVVSNRKTYTAPNDSFKSIVQ